MASFDPRTGTFSSAAQAVRDDIARLGDSDLHSLLIESQTGSDAAVPSARSAMEETYYRRAMSRGSVRRSLAEHRRVKREQKRKERARR